MVEGTQRPTSNAERPTATSSVTGSSRPFSDAEVVADDHDHHFLAHFAAFEERVQGGIGALLQGDEHAIHQTRIGPARQRVQLRFPHFRSRHHLHGFGDLRGIADRFDPAPNILRVCHWSLGRLPRAVTRHSLAHVKANLALLRLRRREQLPDRGEKLRDLRVV